LSRSERACAGASPIARIVRPGPAGQVPATQLRRSISSTSRQRPSSRLIRSRRPTSRKPQLLTRARLAAFSGKMPALQSPDAVALRDFDQSLQQRLADAAAGLTGFHVYAYFGHAGIARPARHRSERGPAEQGAVRAGPGDEASSRAVRRVPLLSSGSFRFEGSVACRNPFEVDGSHLVPITGLEGLNIVIQHG